MRDVSNEVLALWTKKVRVSGQDFISVDLGPAPDVAVSPLRSGGRVRYYQYADGQTERLIVSALPEQLVFRPLVRPHIEVRSVRRGGLDLRIQVAPYCQVESVCLVVGVPQAQIAPTRRVGDLHSFTIGDLHLPALGGELRALIQVTVAGTGYSVQHPVPHCDVDLLLRGSGLGAVDLGGTLRVFVDGDRREAVQRFAAALASGTIKAPFIEPIATGTLPQPFGPLQDAQGLPCGHVSVDGIEYLIVAASPRALADIDDWLARRMAATLTWVPSRERGPGRSGRRPRSQVRGAGRAAIRQLRRRAILGALGVLGYDRYHRAKAAAAAVKPRNAYWEYVERAGTTQIQPRTILHVGFHHAEFSGHLVRLAMEFARLQPGWRQVIAVHDPGPARRTCQRLGIPAEIVSPTSRRYAHALLSSEIVVTDSTLPRWYTPSPGQRFFNVWHGTPMKAMGRAIGGDPRAMGNTQRNFLQSTALLLSNEHTAHAYVRDYMIARDTVEVLPSPRNSWLFEDGARARIRQQLGIADDECVVLYLPTWRGTGNSMKDLEENVGLFRRFSQVRARVSRRSRFYAKPHRFTLAKVDPADLGLLLPPDDLDLYEFLNAVDVLVTDYSSVLFDFLALNRPIVLDTADIDRYSGSRGFYIQPSELGLTLAPDEDALVAAIEGAPRTQDHSRLVSRFAPLDGPRGAQEVASRMLRPTGRSIPEPVRERVLLYPGALKTNGITTAFLNLLANLDLSARDYWVFLPESFTSNPGEGVMEAILASGVNYLPTPGGFVVRRREKVVHHKFTSRLALSPDELRLLDDMMLREADRILPGMHFDHVVHFAGYEAFIAKFLGALTLRGSSLHTWVHNDMRREQELRRNFNEQILMECYHRSSTVNVVSEPVAARLLDGYFTAEVAAGVRVVHNASDSATVTALAHADVPYLTAELRQLLDDPAVVRFVNIGRFSPEKDQLRLVEAFETISRSHPDRATALFLIGGPGNSRQTLLARIASSAYRDRIHVFEGINPHPILSRCDLFVLSSHYEGLPMVFFEALALDVPILSTAIPGPKEFLEEGYGNTCPDSLAGLVSGMEAFLEGRLPPRTKSLEDYNQRALAEFEGIFAATRDPHPPGPTSASGG